MKFVRVNGVLLHYVAEGPEDAPVLVFANSLGTDHRVWSPLLPQLRRSYRIIRYDKRGHGLSQATAEPYALADHIADLAGLLDRLDVPPAVVCGVSVGGAIALGLAAAKPDRVRCLVLCDTAHRIGDKDMWNRRIAATRNDGLASIRDGVMERWFSPAFRRDQADAVAGWATMLERTTLDGYLGTCAALRDMDQTSEAQALSVPVLCLGGDKDGATPPDVVRGLADLIPGSQFLVIDGAGHLPSIEQPEALAAAIEKFLEEKRLV